MKVDGTSPSSIINVKTNNRVGISKTKMPNLGTDQVAVSNKAQSFQTLLLKAKELPALREEKVRDLSDQLANGQFKVDTRGLAKRLVDGPIK